MHKVPTNGVGQTDVIDLLRLAAQEEGAELRLRERTIRTYRCIWAEYCEYLQGRSPLVASVEDVLGFLAEIGQATPGGRRGRPRTGCLSYQTRASQLLARAYRGVIRLRLRDDNPAEAIVIEQSIAFREDRPPPRALSSASLPRDAGEAINRIRAAAAAQSSRSDWKVARNKALISLALDTAAKPAELAELTLGDVTKYPDGTHFVFVGEGPRRRQLRLGHYATCDLDEWLQLHASMKLPRRVLFPATASTADGTGPKPLSPQALYKICREVLEDAGLQYHTGKTPAGFGVLRNTSLVSQRAKGRSFADVHSRSGHLSETSTQVLLERAQGVMF